MLFFATEHGLVVFVHIHACLWCFHLSLFLVLPICLFLDAVLCFRESRCFSDPDADGADGVGQRVVDYITHTISVLHFSRSQSVFVLLLLLLLTCAMFIYV